MKTPSAWAPAALSERGCEAARKTGLERFTHGRCAVPPRYEAGRARRSSLTNTRPSASSAAGRVGAPRFPVPLWPTPMRSTGRPGARSWIEAIEAADTGGWRSDEIAHAHGDPGPPRLSRQERRRHPRVHRVAGRVGDSDHVVAEAVRRLCHCFHERDVVGPEEEADLHGWLAVLHPILADIS